MGQLEELERAQKASKRSAQKASKRSTPADRGNRPESGKDVWDAASVLARVEVNAGAGMCRFSVRSADAALNEAVSKLVMSQLAAS